MDKINRNEKLISLNDKLDTSHILFDKLTETIFVDKVQEIIDKLGLS